jgi:hypothetical protein
VTSCGARGYRRAGAPEAPLDAGDRGGGVVKVDRGVDLLARLHEMLETHHKESGRLTSTSPDHQTIHDVADGSPANLVGDPICAN